MSPPPLFPTLGASAHPGSAEKDSKRAVGQAPNPEQKASAPAPKIGFVPQFFSRILSGAKSNIYPIASPQKQVLEQQQKPQPPDQTMQIQPPPRPAAPSPTVSASRPSPATAASALIPPSTISLGPERPLQLFRFSDFDLYRTLGTGTFGRVQLARYRGVEKYFAMKVMKKSEIIRLKQVDHVFSERLLLSKLCFPFIIKMYGTFQDESNLYMLLEYAIGGELFSYLRKLGRFSIGAARFYACEIILALEYLHASNIAYRDLKPENILLDAQGHVKLADFGFAKVVPAVTWTLCGTPEYLAPEIILNKGHGKAADWWALGVLIYEMIAGYPPFYGDTPVQVYEKIVAGRLEFSSQFDPLVVDLIQRLLNPDPAARIGVNRAESAEIRVHPWFNGVDWTAVYRKSYPAPIVPKFKHPGDTSCFDQYSEETPSASAALADPYRDLFKNF